MENRNQPPVNFLLQPKKLKAQLLISLMALSLTVSILLRPAIPTYPQPPSVQALRDEITEKIKEHAERHVDLESSLQTSTVLKAFEDNQAGLTEAEIIQIYETEFQKLKEEKDSNLIEKLFPNVGWIVALLLILFQLFGATFKIWIQRAIIAIGENIYNKLAGKRFFRGIALSRYREALFKKHKELRIAFRANRPLDMQRVYISLKAEDLNSSTQIDAYEAISKYQRLVVIGSPGSGKSMLLRHIALTYGAGRLILPKRPIPVLIELHRLGNPGLTQETLIQEFVDAFGRDNFPRAERFIRQSLQQGSLMLLFDGLDEVNSEARPKVVQEIKDLLDTYEDCRAIITCRTAVYRDDFVNVANQTLKVAEFNDQQIRCFLRAWEQEIPKDKSIEQLLQTLRDRPRIVELAKNPLLLTIIAHLYCDPSFVLPSSRAEFYQESTTILLEQWDRWRGGFNKYKQINKRRILQHLALFSQDSASQDQQDRRTMNYFAVLEEIRKVLPDLSLEPNENDEAILNEIVERSGLLLAVDGGEGYQFSHLTLQEYFAAEALKNDADGLIDRFRQAPDEWREITKLWCGLENNSSVLIQAVFDIDAITGLECLSDAQEVEPTIANSIIDHFKEQLGTAERQNQIVSAFGAVAADSRSRGKVVFQFLEALLDNPHEAIRHQAVADALSLTNRYQAAHVLGRHYESSSKVRAPLVRMGDLAVDVLRSLAPHHLTAMEDLFIIGSPHAAKALASLLEGNSPFKQQRAAWYLASLLLQPGVEEALHSGISEVQHNDTSLNWIWEPFGEPSGSPFSSVIGQIASLISSGNSLVEAIPNPLPPLDPRLIIPLCAVHLQEQVTFSAPPRLRTETGRIIAHLKNTITVEESMKKAISKLLKFVKPSPHWQLLLSGLSLELQFDLLKSIIFYHSPSKSNWRNIFYQSTYEFKTGWEYRCILLIAITFSIIAALGISFLALQQTKSPWTGFLSFAFIVILTFWISITKNPQRLFDPHEFYYSGFSGLKIYLTMLRYPFLNDKVWREVRLFYNAVNSKQAVIIAFVSSSIFAAIATVANIVVFNSAIIFIVAVTSITALSGAIVTFISGVAPKANADTIAGNDAITRAFFVIVIGTGAIATAGIATSIAASAAIGLGIWYRFQKNPPDKYQQIIKFLTIFAFPWFCWFPIVVVFASLFVHNAFSLTWLSIALIGVFILGICKLLWWNGRRIEAIAINPLRGGVLLEELKSIEQRKIL